MTRIELGMQELGGTHVGSAFREPREHIGWGSELLATLLKGIGSAWRQVDGTCAIELVAGVLDRYNDTMRSR